MNTTLRALLFLTFFVVPIQGEVPTLSLTLSAPRTIIGATDDFIVVASVTNSSVSPVSLDFGSHSTDYAIELHDMAGRAVPDSAFGRRMKESVAGGGLGPLLPSGGVRSVTIDISQFFDIPDPGTYTVKVSKAAGYNHNRLESNVIVVTILPASAIMAPAAAGPKGTQPAPSLAVAGSGPASRHIGMVIEVDRDAIFVGKPLPVYVRLKNPPPMDLSLPGGLGGYYRFDVRRADGESAPALACGTSQREWQEPVGGPSAPPHAAAGQYGNLDVTKCFDMTETGTYFVQAWIKVPEQFGGGELRSNVISVTVKPR
jgi:hypothetical protein